MKDKAPFGADETDPERRHAAVGFDTGTGGQDLKKRSVRSGAITLTSQAVQFVLQLASTTILARLLAPEDFGIIAMATTITAFVLVFRDMGLSSATIQSAEITHAQINTMFWLNILVGSVLTIAVAGVAPVLVWFFDEPELLWVILALSTAFLISSFGIQHGVLLNREMRFGSIAGIRITSAFIGFTTSVLAAIAGMRYWALVWGTLVTTITTVCLTWIVSKWRPSRPAGAEGIRSLFHFGANVTGSNIVNYFARNFDNLLIGRVWGAAPLGLYSKAYGLLMLPIDKLRQPLDAVAYPAMSRLQADPLRFRRYFRNYLSVLAFASMPLVAFLSVGSDHIIHLVLGRQWGGANAIFRVLALSAFIQPALSLGSTIMLSTGQSRRYFRWALVNASATVCGFFAGIAWGPVGVATAYAIVNYTIAYPALRYACKGSPAKVKDFFQATAKPIIASISAAAVAFLVRSWVPSSSDFVILAACGGAFAISYLAVFAAMPDGRKELQTYLSYLTLLFSSGRTKTVAVPSV